MNEGSKYKFHLDLPGRDEHVSDNSTRVEMDPADKSNSDGVEKSISPIGVKPFLQGR